MKHWAPTRPRRPARRIWFGIIMAKLWGVDPAALVSKMLPGTRLPFMPGFDGGEIGESESLSLRLALGQRSKSPRVCSMLFV